MEAFETEDDEADDDMMPETNHRTKCQDQLEEYRSSEPSDGDFFIAFTATSSIVSDK